MSTAGTHRLTERKAQTWTHPSVVALGGHSDPVSTIAARAREIVFRGIQAGWSGPPYDPFALAELLKIEIEPSQEVVDARILPVGDEQFRIEFNPNRSKARTNFSVAHELAHTLFPDCAQTVRNRSLHSQLGHDDWQLEALCNVGAAEILMPVGSFKFDEGSTISIDAVGRLQREFSVSSEAVLLRMAKLTAQRCFVFATHRNEEKRLPNYNIDYAANSRSWEIKPPTGFTIPGVSVVEQCTAIGFTAKGVEKWNPNWQAWNVECLGIAPYPGDIFPRVVGIANPTDGVLTDTIKIQYLKGDATQPRGNGRRILVQIVNDKAITWGRGFSAAIRHRWPHTQKDFTRWVFEHRPDFQLGNTHSIEIDESLKLTSLIAQHGYGPSLFPRIVYTALEQCLKNVATQAKESGSSVHMPRIGSGEAGGNWNIVAELIDEILCGRGIPVTVYDLPGAVNAPTKGLAVR
jgi:O-acetyl-ADP-ribose deacetylase (regulator of RNase III)